MPIKGDLTHGEITGTLLRFTLPMIVGALLQQCYNIADTLIVGQFIGAEALAAVGSAYTLMVFLISILLGLSMGSGTVFSLQYGAGQIEAMRRSIYVSSGRNCKDFISKMEKHQGYREQMRNVFVFKRLPLASIFIQKIRIFVAL